MFTNEDMIDSFPKILIPTFQFGVYVYTLDGSLRPIKMLNPSYEFVSYDIISLDMVTRF